MAVDASIPLQVRPFQMQDPLERYGNALQIQGAQQANALRAQQMQQAQADRAEAMRVRETRNALLAKGLSPDELEAQLMRAGDVDTALRIGKDRRENRKNDAAAAKDEAETKAKLQDVQIKRGDRIIAAFGNAKDQASWNQALQVFALTEGPEEAARLPQQFDPNVSQQMLQRMVPALERMKLEQAALIAKQNNAVTMRGQDITASTTRRGQDMTDAREREVPRGVPLETATGPVLVNPRTGQATPVTVDGKAVAAKQPEFAKKETAGIDAQFNAIDGAIEAVLKTPDAFGFKRGMATKAGDTTESIAQKFSTDDQIKARSFVFNNVSKIINERAGAAQSAQELSRLRGFLPADTDDARVIKAKLEGFKEYLAEQRKAYAPGAASTSAPSAAGVSIDDLVRKHSK